MPQPNILIFLTGDQGCGDLSCMGQTDFRTPHLDRQLFHHRGLGLSQPCRNRGSAVCLSVLCRSLRSLRSLRFLAVLLCVLSLRFLAVLLCVLCSLLFFGLR